LKIDATHWGTGDGYSGNIGSFFNFGELDITNVANGSLGQDTKVNITGFSANEVTTISNTQLNFAVTVTDGDGDQVTSTTDSLLVTLDGSHTGSGYQLTGTNTDPEVFATSMGNDSIVGGTGPGDTIDYSNTTGGVGVTVNLTGETDTVAAAVGGAATGDVIKGIENVIGSNNGDTLTGNSLNNILVGGKGDDILNGGSGNDTFVWMNGDQSLVAGSPAADTVQLFATGDVLDLKDLLPDAGTPTYLYVTQDGTGTTVHVTDGTGPIDGTHDVQTIFLAGYTGANDSVANILNQLTTDQTYTKA
jgi:Ca2+-binding RTX toxin-like protein